MPPVPPPNSPEGVRYRRRVARKIRRAITRRDARRPGSTPEAAVWGYCYRCRRERPVLLKPGLPLAPHEGRDGIKCPGSGKRPGYFCSPPDAEEVGP